MFRRADRLLFLVTAILALGASVASLGNGFALDDLPIIRDNPRVHTLAAPWTFLGQTYWPSDQGPALYRPLTLLGFAVQWVLGGGSPAVFHLTSVLLYVVASLAAAWLALQILPRPAAFLVAALFAVHPVHVEAVGNVVGQSEVIVGALVAFATGWYVRARKAGLLGAGDGLVLGLSYAAALAAKEHAVVLPALLVLAELLLVADPTPVRQRVERLLPVILTLAAVLIGFWAIRTVVTGGLVGRDIHPAFRAGGLSLRVHTMLGVVPEWVRLLLFPLHLSADYNPQQVRVLTAAGWSGALGGFLVLVAGWGAWLLRRRVPTVSFGLLWAAVTLFPVSNLLIPTGILLAERTLFLPSLGVLLAVGGAASGLLPGLQRQPARRRWLVFAGLWLVLAAWVIRSAVRQPVWKDNATLFARTLVDAPRSYKAVAAHAVMLLEAGQEVEGEREYRRALGLFPDDPNLFADLGDWYLRKGRCEEALDSYARVLALVPAHWAATSRTILCLIRLGRLAEAREAARVATRRGDEGASQKLAYVDSLIAARNRVP
jgi:hypothetical protein